MKKTILLLFAALLLIPTASALQIDPADPGNITLNPGESTSKTWTVNLEGNETEVSVNARDDGDFTTSFITFPPYEDGDDIKFDIVAPDTGNYSYNVSLTFEAENDTHTLDTATKFFRAETELKRTTLLEPTWINDSAILNFNGDKRDVTSIKSNLWMNDTSVGEGESTTINDVRLDVIETVGISSVAKIEASTTSEDATFSVSHRSTNEAQGPCALSVDQVSVQLNRNQIFTFYTVNSNTGERIENVQVAMYDANGLLEGTSKTSDGNGQVRVLIPPEAKGQQLEIDLTKPSSECSSATEIANFGQTREQFQENNPAFQLELSVDKEQAINKVAGSVTNAEGEVLDNDPQNFVEIQRPNGESTETQFNESGFVYRPEEPGDYELTATRPGYRDSNTVSVTVLSDGDGDGVPNNGTDECPEEEGTKENKGCSPENVDIQFLAEGEEVDEIHKGVTYTVRLVSGNDTAEADGNVTVTAPERDAETVEIENGEGEFTPSSTGEYEVEWTGSPRYNAQTRSVDASKQSMNLWKLFVVALVAVTFLYSVYRGYRVFLSEDGFEGADSSETGQDKRPRMRPPTSSGGGVGPNPPQGQPPGVGGSEESLSEPNETGQTSESQGEEERF